ncbi:MAG: hypothetical protein RBT73_05555 [Spirochaetia bacterium]|jgi:hypothetical protein|nr:hypothetical protein [Spirochaetia bacterium]
MNYVSIEYEGFKVSGHVTSGAWEGDPGVVHGIHVLAPYVEDLSLCVEGFEHYLDLTPEFIERAERALIDEWKKTTGGRG